MFNLRKKKERAVDHQLRLAHENSLYRDMPFDRFVQEVHQLAASNDGAIDFDDRFYRSANADVDEAVAAGNYVCGYVHYCLVGHTEPRLWSTRHVTRRFGLQPMAGQGLFKATNTQPPVIWGPDLSALPSAVQPTLLVLLPSLQEELFFAGYSGFFADLKTIFPVFSRVIIGVVSPQFSTALAHRYDERIEVMHIADLARLTEKPTLIFNFDFSTFHIAKDIFNDLDRTIYYCQDFEAGFFPYGSAFVRAEQAVAHSRNIVLSTGMLKNFLEDRKLLSANRVHVTAPSVKPVIVDPVKKKRLFFYFRPERFNSRNMPEFISAVVDAFCRKHQGYEIFLCGAVQTCYSTKVHGTDVSVLSKLPKLQYEELLGSCDVVVAMIYSAHPGVIAFQAAASGIPTVTNTFEGRDANVLQAISENIVPFDPVRDDLLEKLEAALQLPKGQPSFQAHLYEGRSAETFAQYVNSVMQACLQSAQPAHQ